MTQQPNYSVFKIDLTNAGSQVIDMEGDFFHFAGAFDQSGVLDLGATIRVQLGTAVDDDIPASVNTKIRGLTRRYRVSWEAQTGIMAEVLISRVSGPDEGIEADTPPTRQLVTSATATGVGVAAVSVGTSAVLLRAASATRQSVTIRNNGSGVIYIGPSGVTTATGFNVEPGESFTFEGTTTAIYGIADSGTQACRVIEEA